MTSERMLILSLEIPTRVRRIFGSPTAIYPHQGSAYFWLPNCHLPPPGFGAILGPRPLFTPTRVRRIFGSPTAIYPHQGSAHFWVPDCHLSSPGFGIFSTFSIC